MSTSEKQIEANRQNAQKSTGPKTEEGKKTSSQNSITHGINAVDITINSPRLKENQSDYDLLVASLTDELRPKSVFQEHLVYKIANCLWRYRRVISAETAEINRQLTPDHSNYHYNEQYYNILEDAGELVDFLNSRTIPTSKSADHYRIYEWRLNRE